MGFTLVQSYSYGQSDLKLHKQWTTIGTTQHQYSFFGLIGHEPTDPMDQSGCSCRNSLRSGKTAIANNIFQIFIVEFSHPFKSNPETQQSESQVGRRKRQVPLMTNELWLRSSVLRLRLSTRTKTRHFTKDVNCCAKQSDKMQRKNWIENAIRKHRMMMQSNWR